MLSVAILKSRPTKKVGLKKTVCSRHYRNSEPIYSIYALNIIQYFFE